MFCIVFRAEEGEVSEPKIRCVCQYRNLMLKLMKTPTYLFRCEKYRKLYVQ